MKLPFAFLSLGAGVFLLWIAFHDIGTMLDGQTPTLSNVFGLLQNNFAKPAATPPTGAQGPNGVA